MRNTDLVMERQIELLLNNLKKYIVISFIFLFPLLVFPFFREIFYIGKTIFAVGVALLILALNFFQLLLTKKIELKKNGFEGGLFLVLLAYFLTWVVVTPNKMQALFVSTEGLLFIFSLIVVIRTAYVLKIKVIPILIFSSAVVSFSLILSFTNVFENINLPDWLSFLKSPYFTPMGSYLEALIFIVFSTIYSLVFLFSRKSLNNKGKINTKYLYGFTSVLGIFAVILGVYNILNPVEVNGQTFKLILPPFRESWYAAVEILKNPFTAVFGIGINNFSSIFTKVKTLNYNQSDLWTIGSFNLSASAFLHIFTTLGVLGLFSFVYLLVKIYNNLYKQKELYNLIGFFLLLFSFLIFPLTSISIFLLLGFIAEKELNKEQYLIDLSKVFLVYLVAVGSFLAFIIALFYNLSRYTVAEFYFSKALQAARENDARRVFDLHRQAILNFPYLEDLRRSFAEVNLFLLNNSIRQLSDESKKEDKNEDQINNLRNTINQVTQVAISEAKALVALNPQKASSWAFLADIYRNIIFLAENASEWAITSYQRAVALDPLNPTYQLNLGGVYFALEDYKNAEKNFENLISIKPNWANAYYNYAWSLYQQESYPEAVRAMEMALALLESSDNYDENSYDRVKKELEEFRRRLPEVEQKEATPSAVEESEEINIPTPTQTDLENKIELPEEASTEAQ